MHAVNDSEPLMKASNGSNQAEDLSQGHTPNGDMSDPHLHTTQGMSIGAATNFGIEHYGEISGMHEGTTGPSVYSDEE